MKPRQYYIHWNRYYHRSIEKYHLFENPLKIQCSLFAKNQSCIILWGYQNELEMFDFSFLHLHLNMRLDTFYILINQLKKHVYNDVWRFQYKAEIIWPLWFYMALPSSVLYPTPPQNQRHETWCVILSFCHSFYLYQNLF